MKKLLLLIITMQITLFANIDGAYIQINSGDVVEDHVNYLEKKYYEIEVPRTQTVTIKLTDLEADLDLYIATNRIAKIKNNDCYSSKGNTNNEKCVLSSTAPKGKTNSIIIMVYGFKASNYKLEVTTKEGEEKIPTISANLIGDQVKKDEGKQYKFAGKKGESYITTLSNLSADADLRVSIGRKANLQTFTCKSIKGGTNTDECTVTLKEDATVYVQIYGYRAANYKLATSKVLISAQVSLKKLKKMIAEGKDVTQVDTSKITDMGNLFKGNPTFNQDISKWDVSKVDNMSGMFSGATSFNQPIGNWNVSNVTYAKHMFSNATSFNQPLGNWDVSSMENVEMMFGEATSFNQPIGNWDISNIKVVNDMFWNATSFNQPLGKWNLSNVYNARTMFTGAKNMKEENKPIF